ncbi:MAG: YCF48-related protein [Pirellulaceae bacterium]
MYCQGNDIARSRGAAWCCRIVTLFGWLVLPAAALADPPSSPGEMLQVAELLDVFFVDRLKGWAVGERGVIWSTDDGGRSWHLTDSPATARLECIRFVSPTHGWIAGGWIHPTTHKSSAYLLRTDTGGRRWTRVTTPGVPALRWIAMSDLRRGWALSNASTLFPCGALHTDDGGFTWNSQGSSDRLTFVTAAARHDHRLIAVDQDSMLWLAGSGGCEPVGKPSTGLPQIHALMLDGPRGWLVGDGGLVLTTQDGGLRWEAPRRPLPAELAHEFDWHTVAVRGSSCWMAGSPGTCVVLSSDGGATWQCQPTGQSLPIRKIWFLDEQCGWAVGACGTILATQDGGKSWEIQRQGVRRAALAGMFSRIDGVPWELYAGAAADEGYSCVVSLLTMPRGDVPRETPWFDRAREAASYAGASIALPGWPFPVTKADAAEASVAAITADWDRAGRATALERLEERVVQQIRLWRPDVVVADALHPDGQQPFEHAVAQTVLQAVQRAGDPGAFPQQLRVARLEPWTVKKTFNRMPLGQRGPTTIDTQRLAIQLGCTLAQYAMISRAVLSAEPDPAPESIELRLSQSHGTVESASRGLFQGLPPSVIGDARRAPVRYGGVNLDLLRRLVQQQREIQALVVQTSDAARPVSELWPHLDRMTAGVSPHFSGVLLVELAQNLVRRGDRQVATDILQRFLQRHPDHLLAEGSLDWLLRHYGSAECQYAFSAAADRMLPAVVQQTRPGGQSTAGAAGPARLPPTEVQLASFQEVVPAAPAQPVEVATPAALRSALDCGERIRQTNSTLFREPEVQFLLASIYRRLGDASSATRTIDTLANANLPLEWHTCARGEQWLAGSAPRAPRPVLTCLSTGVKPYLDGVLDEPIWQTAAPAELHPMDRRPGPATEVRFAYDEGFLYFGARCQKVPGIAYSAASEPRTHDALRPGQDRVEFVVDTDRDYASGFRFAIDHRGLTREEVMAESKWNPTWHVVTHHTPEAWCVEVAIPLNALTPAPLTPESAPWGLNIVRTIPGAASQAWSTPVPSPGQLTGCGYLVFR